MRLSLLWTVFIGSMFGWWLIDTEHTFIDDLIMLAMILVTLIPIVIWQMNHPATFNITTHAASVSYEFADPAYATEFQELNMSDGGDENASLD